MLNLQFERHSFKVDSYPNHCPVCKSRISAIQTPTYTEPRENSLEVAYCCPSEDCGSLFVARFERLKPSPTTINAYHTLVECVPYSADKPDIVEEVANLSPLFVEIFTQSYQAEALNMKQISGIGYRKSLEFLIKDFCISSHPDKSEEIKGAPLAKCIGDYIDDIRIKECARRASWLGNDEAHYVRKWSDKDVEDLKILIRLCALWIQSHILTEAYAASMEKT
ncbi:hypothetical protein [Halomonas sp. BM-2019]|uniref:hypothetical protein n=1 Tax=Halomonas sp. BM-2019 TaxID=2811227 RepID=UPI001B3C41AB|nr:MAG: DUF4145 domain-containing protein [Halomonas sp. BM-2019]